MKVDDPKILVDQQKKSDIAALSPELESETEPTDDELKTIAVEGMEPI